MNTRSFPQVSIYHSILWSNTKAWCFRKFIRRAVRAEWTRRHSSGRNGGAASRAGGIDLSYHRYPYRLLFEGSLRQRPSSPSRYSFVERRDRNPCDLVVLPNYDRFEYWVMLLICILLRRKRAVVCTQLPMTVRGLAGRKSLKVYFFGIAMAIFATELGASNTC